MEWLAPQASFSPHLAPGFEYRVNAFGAHVIVAKTEAPWPAAAAAAAAAAPPSAPAAAAQKCGGGGGGGGGGAPPRAYRASVLSLEERFALVKSVGEECIQEEELLALLKAKAHPVCYDGFEPSGRMHIAQGILKALLVNKLTAAGCVFKFWVADWFALLNDKMGGNLEHIKLVGRYMVEVWRAAGMDMTNVEFLWASDEINSHSNEYWLRVMDIARRNNLPRILRCCTIMGRAETDDLTAAQIFYPAMQCADIFHLKVRARGAAAAAPARPRPRPPARPPLFPLPPGEGESRPRPTDGSVHSHSQGVPRCYARRPRAPACRRSLTGAARARGTRGFMTLPLREV
jgi:hypothetical protein